MKTQLSEDGTILHIHIPMKLRRRGGRKVIVTSGDTLEQERLETEILRMKKNPFSEFQTPLCLPKKCRTILQRTDIKHIVSGRILKK